MATQEYSSSIQGVAVRVTRLDANGTPLNGPGDSYTTHAFMRVSFTPEYEEGDEITEKSANGAVCVSFKSPDTLKRITMEFAICDPDPELTSLLSGGLLLRKNLGTFASPDHKSVGWASPAVGDDPSGNGVAIEAWSRAIVDGKPSSTLPFYHWVFPYAKLRQSGDRVIENGLLANTFEGYGLGNVLFGSGLDDRWEWPEATNRPYSFGKTNWAPQGLRGFYTWHSELTTAISNKSLNSNVATLTTSTPHGFAAGDQVNVSAVDATFDGTYTILSVPTPTTFTYAKTAANVTATAATGTARVAAGARAVTELESGDTATDFNVPGNVGYDATRDVDFIIGSVEDPSA
ncbi:major tail protein [Microbacterium phage Cece]|nr:major tail protein [Microbacterium phage Cece]